MQQQVARASGDPGPSEPMVIDDVPRDVASAAH